ncbi:MAG TPA: hypothetical protein VHY91_20990 [Pirellulales bacterium]|nr:hypothetical protein [Pirellulales bacterium]
MASDFFSIVALVVALSGASFTLILTIRQLTRDRVVAMQERSREYRAAVAKDGSKSLNALAATGNVIFNVGYWVWFLSLLAPLLVFAVYSWVSATRVLEYYYEPEKHLSPTLAAATASTESGGPAEQALPTDPAATAGGPFDRNHDPWFNECIICQMWWLWLTKWLGLWSVLGAAATAPVMLSGLWMLSRSSSAMEESSKIVPAGKPTTRQPKK